MCGIVGFWSSSATEEDLECLRVVLLESEIRGRHASGVAWHDGQQLHCASLPVPMSTFLEEFSLGQLRASDGSMLLLGHARYSTSDREFNQPIMDRERTAVIVHNGVVTQADPASWRARYGFPCEGRNDSELLLQALLAGRDPLETFPGASIAAAWIVGRRLFYARNGLRPLWRATLGAGEIVASTEHILLSAGLDPEPVPATLEDSQERSWSTWSR